MVVYKGEKSIILTDLHVVKNQDFFGLVGWLEQDKGMGRVIRSKTSLNASHIVANKVFNISNYSLVPLLAKKGGEKSNACRPLASVWELPN